MIMYYGYTDGSGGYYIVVDAGKCDGCGDCVRQCPQSALELAVEVIDLEDRTVAAVIEGHRKRVKYTCASCRPDTNMTPCVLACRPGAINCVWESPSPPGPPPSSATR